MSQPATTRWAFLGARGWYASSTNPPEAVVVMSFIADHQTASVITGLIGLVGSLGYIAWRLQNPESPAKTPLPSATPRPASFELGQAEHQRAGQAATVKLAQVKPTPKEAPTEKVQEAARSLDQKAKAQRMQELGFHAGIDRTPPPMPAIVVPAASNAAEATIAADLSGAAEPVANNRGQTAELDDILSRIDKVLAENPVMATNTMTGATDTNASSKDETAEIAKPTPGGQQKLF